MATTTNAQTGYQSLTVPCDNEQGTFIIERLQCTRISIRIGKTALFMTYAEADRVAEAMTELMNGTKSPVRR